MGPVDVRPLALSAVVVLEEGPDRFRSRRFPPVCWGLTRLLLLVLVVPERPVEPWIRHRATVAGLEETQHLDHVYSREVAAAGVEVVVLAR